MNSLTVVGNKLYGALAYGGSAGDGSIFSMNPDGSDYTVLFEFTDNLAHGEYPSNTLLLQGEYLFGTTNRGGLLGQGVLYKIKTDGTQFEVLASMGDSFMMPYRNPLLIVDNVLYGMADGSSWYTNYFTEEYGTIYKYVLSDTFPPTVSDVSPTAGSVLTSAVSNITFVTDESATCRLSLTDESYADMSDDVVCSGGGTTDHSCISPDLGSDGAKTVYIACIDALTNEDTVDSNEQVNYTLTLSVTPTPTPTPTPVSNSTSSSTTPAAYSPPACSEQWNRESTVSIFSGKYLSPSSITLVFEPALGADGYTIWYGPDATTQHAASFATSDASGMLSYTINDLYPSNEWHVAITPHKGCVEGKQSGEFIVKRNVVSNVPVLTDNPDSDSEDLPTISAPNAQPTPDGSSLLSPSPSPTSQITQEPTASMAPKTAPKTTPAPSERSATPFSWLERLIQWAQGLFSS